MGEKKPNQTVRSWAGSQSVPQKTNESCNSPPPAYFFTKNTEDKSMTTRGSTKNTAIASAIGMYLTETKNSVAATPMMVPRRQLTQDIAPQRSPPGPDQQKKGKQKSRLDDKPAQRHRSGAHTVLGCQQFGDCVHERRKQHGHDHDTHGPGNLGGIYPCGHRHSPDQGIIMSFKVTSTGCQQPRSPASAAFLRSLLPSLHPTGKCSSLHQHGPFAKPSRKSMRDSASAKAISAEPLKDVKV